MKRLSMTALLVLCGTSLVFAQKSEQKSPEGDSRQSQKKAKSQSDSSKSRQKQSSDDENEVRLRYDDERDRMEIEVDEDINFRDEDNRPSWAKNGDFDVRYDADDNILRMRGEGTINVERAASNMARWWQSWWEEERTARRSLQLGSESGARLFVRQHDRNDDNYLSRKELPQDEREDFEQVDRNQDGHLSVSEVRRYGQDYFEATQRQPQRRDSSAHRTARQNLDDDSGRTWNEWWASWWSEQDQDADRLPADVRRDVMKAGARRFIEQHDSNDDGYLVRSELPESMYDDFSTLDTDDDRKISRQEIMRKISADRRNRQSR